MDTLDRIYEMMYCELDDLGKKEKLDSKDVELIYKFVDIIKDINEIDITQENMNGYSQMNGSSYMRGRSGRMTSYGRSGNRGSSYGRDGGYSRTDNKEIMLNHLQDVMDMAMDEKDRRAISKLMSQMEQQ